MRVLISIQPTPSATAIEPNRPGPLLTIGARLSGRAVRRLRLAWLVLVVVLALSGCAAQPDGGSSTSTGLTWNPAAWQPPHPVVIARLDADEQERRRRTWLEFEAETFKLTDPPALPKVRRWLLWEETGPAWASCMSQSGWTTVVANPDGNGATATEPVGQAKAFYRAYYLCKAEYPIDARLLFQGPQSPEILGMTWDYVDGYLTPCLVAHGYRKPDDFPSREVFIAQPVAYPYPNGADPTVQHSCPQNMPGSLLIGPT